METVRYRVGSRKNELQSIYKLGNKPVKNENHKAHIVCSTFNTVDKMIKSSRSSIGKAGASVKRLSKKIDEMHDVPETMKTYQENILSLLKIQRNITLLTYIIIPLVIVSTVLFCTTNIRSKQKLLDATNTFSDSFWYTNGMTGIASSRINLPSEINGINIDWSSSDDSVIDPLTGSVFPGQYDQDVTLTGNFKCKSGHISKSYNVSVLHDPNFISDDKGFSRVRVSKVTDTIYDIDFAQSILLTNDDVLKFLREFDIAIGENIPMESQVVSAYDSNNNSYIYNVEGELGNRTTYYTLYCNKNFIPTRVDKSVKLKG